MFVRIVEPQSHTLQSFEMPFHTSKTYKDLQYENLVIYVDISINLAEETNEDKAIKHNIVSKLCRERGIFTYKIQ